MHLSVSVVLIAARGAATAGFKPLPKAHHQFTTRIETTAHQLNATSDYPPYKRYMTVYYDYTARRARLDYSPVPHMPPKSFVRRYDLGHEWVVHEIVKSKECQKSRLREAMPRPRFPDKLIYLGEVRVRGRRCDHWREDHGGETIEYFEDAETRMPLRLTTEVGARQANPLARARAAPAHPAAHLVAGRGGSRAKPAHLHARALPPPTRRSSGGRRSRRPRRSA